MQQNLPDDIQPVSCEIEACSPDTIRIFRGTERVRRPMNHLHVRAVQIALSEEEPHEVHPFWPRVRYLHLSDRVTPRVLYGMLLRSSRQWSRPVINGLQLLAEKPEAGIGEAGLRMEEVSKVAKRGDGWDVEWQLTAMHLRRRYLAEVSLRPRFVLSAPPTVLLG